MKRISVIIALASAVNAGVAAQPVMSQRALLKFPTYLPFEESNVEWQRDVYREIDLTKGNNGGLGLANEPNIFSTVFLLAVDGLVPTYEYPLTGNETFSEATKVDMKELMKDFEIAYSEEEDGPMVIDSDIPRLDVSSYFIREKVYYDKANSTFRTRVAAFCPVMVVEDEFGEGKVKYPMFWVRYDDIEPYLKDFLVYSSNYNKAAVMTAADYFSRHLYQGEIYKVFNTQGMTLAQICQSDTELVAERRRIEQQLQAVRRNTYNVVIREKEPKTEGPKLEVIKRPTRIRLFGKRNERKQ